MNLITVIPIARGIGKETLTYFSTEKPEKGSVVEISLRSKKAFGIVLTVEKAENKKSEIKSLNFGLKKIEHIQSKAFLLPGYIESVQSIADYYATTTGAVLSALVPKIIFESIQDLNIPIHTSNAERSDVLGEILALQASDEERYGAYKSLIREEFARKNSVFICLPSREEIRMIEQVLRKGIEQYTFVLHNGLSKKELLATWKNILENTHPILIIATGYFLSIPRSDIKTLLVENESSRAFVIPKRPFLDIRMVAEIFSKKMGIKVVFGDTALRVDTVFREREHEIADFSPLKFRVLSSAHTVLTDMRTPKDQTKKEFEIISENLKELLTENKTNNDHAFLFCARKGLSPLTVCADCGDTVSCENCGSPVVLYGPPIITGKTSRSENYFLCHVCGKRRPADILCVRCGSWKLTPLGVGIESAEKEIKKKFPLTTLFIMDRDRVKTHAQAEKIIKKFYDTPGSVLLGTELALPYLKEKMGHTAIVSLDSFFSIPDFRIKEKIMNIMLQLRALAEKMVLVQTRRPTESIFEYALKGNLADFYREEIDERKNLGLPPVNTFIKISLEGSKVEARAKMDKLRNDLLPYELNTFDAFHARVGKKYIVHGLIMMPREKWPDTTLVQKLRSLSPQFSIKIDPDSLL